MSHFDHFELYKPAWGLLVSFPFSSELLPIHHFVVVERVGWLMILKNPRLSRYDWVYFDDGGGGDISR